MGSEMKGQDYYSVVRAEILPLLPAKMDKVLDVGCGMGVTGAFLKAKRGAGHVSGIEIMPGAAAKAREVLDHVESIDLNGIAHLPYPRSHFDLILCLDVLEHLIDPWQALKKISAHLAPGGTLIVSVPNLRHFKTSLPLLFCGRFDYEDSGVRDSTHLRFFTRKSAMKLVGGTGFQIQKVAHNGRPRGSKTWWLNILSLGLLSEFFDFQYLVVAKKS